jgi:hypothetical protein
MLLVTIGLGTLLQTNLEFFWFYSERALDKVTKGYELMVIWPSFVILLIPLVAGAALLICGWCRRRRRTENSGLTRLAGLNS